MNRRKGRVTEEEIHTLINLGQEEGLLDEHEHNLIPQHLRFQ